MKVLDLGCFPYPPRADSVESQQQFLTLRFYKVLGVAAVVSAARLNRKNTLRARLEGAETVAQGAEQANLRP